ncbi:histone-lysine N-methyltransferase SETDB2 isoform X2 [Carassius carassius]|uniref:histone-lysine N-methyltransferase SETDB2 isoform X2 n=1 Tax=Carassius carassius TaxID=217509 RepID=UPI0028694D66|nr:histone-lysine N-methyltransferase SETDB2 isoform X2 [Carassius carassius]XP_059409413.1 histone-lysine N-methyltransferase SETDB2 isoform X2 [Carassius carassius]
MMEFEIEQARRFWEEVDVDEVFDDLLEKLHHLRNVITNNTATDREYVQAMKITLESELTSFRSEGIQEVLIDEEILTVTVSEAETENFLQKDSTRLCRDGESSSDQSQTSAASRAELLLSPLSFCSEEPRSPVHLVYHPHDCSAACVPQLPAHADRFLGHNPLRAPMLCQFQRHCDESDASDSSVLYKAPCGRSLRSLEEVLQFLLQSDSLGVLQPDHFSFDPQIVPENQAQAPTSAALLLERDLSRGIEPVPVSLFNELDGTRPKEFRYRKERWPHGCFLSSAPLFSVCCDCTDDCADAWSCACVQQTLRGSGEQQAYRHRRLSAPLSAGLFECGPWCGCARSRCQNRVVQKGLRVRLQVFRTPDRGWAVRCRDDLDQGTFVCIYAGVVLRQQQSVEEPADGELLVSDDEVEVVEEWKLPAGHLETVSEPLDSSPPLYVPVIQRPADQLKDQQQLGVSSLDRSQNGSEVCEEIVSKRPRLGHESQHKHTTEQMYYLDASKEGNVARFFNHSCEPNLFLQNVFTDTHDPQFPLIAFFTSRCVKAGSELTWNT